MADISKTAWKVVYEYYFATQGAQRMNAPKSLKSKAKKTSKMNLIMLLAHQWCGIQLCPGISKCSVLTPSLRPEATQVLAVDLKSWWNLGSPTLRLAADVNSRILEFRIRDLRIEDQRDRSWPGHPSFLPQRQTGAKMRQICQNTKMGQNAPGVCRCSSRALMV